jgi:hypothetical protein
VTKGPREWTRGTVTIGIVAVALAYVAASLVALWGVAHVIPTGQVLAGFAPVTADNRRIIVQEWLAEAVTLWGIAALVVTTTAVGGATTHVGAWVYSIAAALLVALATLTALTGARTPVIWFKICPVVLSGSAMLLLVAGSQ